jgi:putative transposase
VNIHRATYHYRPSSDKSDEAIRQRLDELSKERSKNGCPMFHAILRREGLVVNHKRTERIYREMGLSLKKRKKKKRVRHLRAVMPPASKPNDRWSMDFMFDQTQDRRRLKIFTLGDDYNREALRIEPGRSIGGRIVTEMLDQAVEIHGKPNVITLDNGPEFTSNAVHEWAYKNGVYLDFIEPGKPGYAPN